MTGIVSPSKNIDAGKVLVCLAADDVAVFPWHLWRLLPNGPVSIYKSDPDIPFSFKVNRNPLPCLALHSQTHIWRLRIEGEQARLEDDVCFHAGAIPSPPPPLSHGMHETVRRDRIYYVCLTQQIEKQNVFARNQILTLQWTLWSGGLRHLCRTSDLLSSLIHHN